MYKKGDNKGNHTSGEFKEGDKKPKNAYTWPKGHPGYHPVLSEEHKEKIGKTLAERPNQCSWFKGKKPWNAGTKGKCKPNAGSFQKGHHRTPKREGHWGWMGGKSFEPYPLDWIDELRESIRKRDDYTCQVCGLHQDELTGWHKKLAVHHIDYQKDNLDPINLVTLCESCHSKTNSNRAYWINYFAL